VRVVENKLIEWKYNGPWDQESEPIYVDVTNSWPFTDENVISASKNTNED
jgi:hypothetical protein